MIVDDIYIAHLHRLINSLEAESTIPTEDGYEVKQDKLSQHKHAVSQGVKMALEAYGICVRDEAGCEISPSDPVVEKAVASV